MFLILNLFLMVNWSKGNTFVDKWKLNDTIPKKKKLRLKGLLVASPYFISQSSLSLPPLSPIVAPSWLLLSFSVRSSHQIATRRCQNSENGYRPAQTGDTHQMERTGKVSTADLTWYLAPKQNKKVEVQDNAGSGNMGWYIFSVECAFFAFLEMCNLW